MMCFDNGYGYKSNLHDWCTASNVFKKMLSNYRNCELRFLQELMDCATLDIAKQKIKESKLAKINSQFKRDLVELQQELEALCAAEDDVQSDLPTLG